MSRKIQFQHLPIVTPPTRVKISSKPTSASDRKKAEDHVKFMSVVVTGVRPGEIVLGTKTQSKDAVIKIHQRFIPPWTRELDRIRAFPELWIKFLNTLASIEFFGTRTLEEREEWLKEHQNPIDTYMDEVEGVEFEVLQLGKSDMRKKVSEEDMDRLLSGEPILGTEVRTMFPRKPGSRAKRVTLIFRRSIWKVTITHREVETFGGPLFDLGSGKLTKGGTIREKKDIILVLERLGESSEDVGFRTPRKGLALDRETIFPLILELHPEVDAFDIERIEQATATFTPAAYKSLLQKIIRFRPRLVDLGRKRIGTGTENTRYPADFVLTTVMALLLIHPGTFVPDIQRYVSGMESAFKRSVVTIFEDSSIPNKNHLPLIRLLCGAMLAQRVKSWRPDADLIRTLFYMGIIAWKRPSAYLYDIPRGESLPPYSIKVASPVFENASALMDELRSFKSDLGMIRDIAFTWSENGGRSPVDTNDRMPDSMPLEHCVDQHWAPEVVYFYPYEVVQELYIPGSRPYSQLMRNIFSITGINPRRAMHPRTYTPDLEEKRFTKQTRNAQRLLLLSRQFVLSAVSSLPVVEEEVLDFDYEIDNSWLAGLVGTLEVRAGKVTALVTLDPRDISQPFVIFRKPAREMKSPELTRTQEEDARQKAIQLFAKGVPLTGAKPPIPSLKGAFVKISKGKYVIQTEKARAPLGWDEFRFGTETLDILLFPSDFTHDAALTSKGQGIMEDAEQRLMHVLEDTHLSVIQRTLYYFSGNNATFEMNHISREGGGTKDAVMIEDVGAYQTLLKLTLLYPSALQRANGVTLRFKVPFAPLLWHVRDRIRQYLELAEEMPPSDRWAEFYDHKDRELFWYQADGLEEMYEAHEAGIKAHFIYMTVGAGKTLTVLSYLKYLQQRGELPPYILYSLPNSAFESVLAEIEAFDLDIRIVVPLQKLPPKYSKNMKKYAHIGCEMHPYTVNMIEHDHLRECGDVLATYMSDAVFIFDEAHKALNDSIRTSVALNLSSLAQETIAMTGTPIIDTKTYKLIRWLERIVDFEVNERNYWVATGAMIKYIVKTDIPVIEEDVVAPFTPKEEAAYQALVPPRLGGKNTNPKQEDIREATRLCYQASTREMVRQVQQFLEEGRGVFVVAQNNDHQETLREKISRNIPEIRSEDVYLIGKGQSLLLTTEAIDAGKVKDYKVVLTTIRHSEGYTLTALSAMVTGVYPSNNATREQLAGRINRPGQYAEDLQYRTAHCGILTYILEHHNDAKNLSAVLRSIAEQIIV